MYEVYESGRTMTIVCRKAITDFSKCRPTADFDKCFKYKPDEMCLQSTKQGHLVESLSSRKWEPGGFLPNSQQHINSRGIE